MVNNALPQDGEQQARLEIEKRQRIRAFRSSSSYIHRRTNRAKSLLMNPFFRNSLRNPRSRPISLLSALFLCTQYITALQGGGRVKKGPQ